MQTHVKVVAILYIVMGALNLLGALFFVFAFSIAGIAAGMSGDPDAGVAIPIIGLTGTALVLFLLILGIPPIIVGVGLMRYREWARIAGIVIAALLIFHFPFGTAIGVYGLWVLLNNETSSLMGERSRPAV
ncbi:MAG: hypothetical protein WD690_02270 [Vicinamibacterales bacterium]